MAKIIIETSVLVAILVAGCATQKDNYSSIESFNSEAYTHSPSDQDDMTWKVVSQKLEKRDVFLAHYGALKYADQKICSAPKQRAIVSNTTVPVYNKKTQNFMFEIKCVENRPENLRNEPVTFHFNYNTNTPDKISISVEPFGEKNSTLAMSFAKSYVLQHHCRQRNESYVIMDETVAPVYNSQKKNFQFDATCVPLNVVEAE